MFTQIHSDGARRQLAPAYISVVLHCAFLFWLVHSPEPTFVAPALVAKGEGGSSVTQVYWPGRPLDSGTGAPNAAAPVSLQHRDSRARLEWTQPPRAGKGRHEVPPPNITHNLNAANRKQGPSAGSPFGSLSEGPLVGSEVRPALPIATTDPFVSRSEVPGGGGDVVIEISIDETGTIVDKRVLVSLGPVIDAKVLAALETWHFQPAMRDGVAIASKQDVHYHFPR